MEFQNWLGYYPISSTANQYTTLEEGTNEWTKFNMDDAACTVLSEAENVITQPVQEGGLWPIQWENAGVQEPASEVIGC